MTTAPGARCDVRIVAETQDCLEAYGQVPIAFTVDARLRVRLVDAGLAGIDIRQEPVTPPWVKDYDVDGERPVGWRRWDLTNWGFFTAFAGQRRVGGAVVARDTPEVHMLEGRADLAVLWDIRVAPEARGAGVGTALFRHAEAWAAGRGCRTLKIETQDINAAACRFYARCGCRLGAVHPHAYDEFPDEVQMLWYKDLEPRP